MIKILIVDDEKIIRKAMGQLFKKYGQCFFADSGQKAFEMFLDAATTPDDSFDLIILDISLEDVDGLRVLKQIREYERKNQIKKADRTKIIMATGNQKLSMVKACISAGCDNYIVKPLKPAEAVAALEKIGIPPLEES